METFLNNSRWMGAFAFVLEEKDGEKLNYSLCALFCLNSLAIFLNCSLVCGPVP